MERQIFNIIYNYSLFEKTNLFIFFSLTQIFRIFGCAEDTHTRIKNK